MRLFVALALMTFATPVFAQASKVAEARGAFERGAAFASEERWGDALAAFSESAALRPHATTTYNIGYCERALGHATRAKKQFALALAQDNKSGGAELTPDLRAASKKYLVEAHGQVATPKLTIPTDAAITIDGRPLEASSAGRWLAGTRPPGPGEKVDQPTFIVEIDAGAHEIVISATDGRSKVAHEYFPPGSTKELKLDLPPATTTTTAAPPIDHGRSRRSWGYVVGGIGVVGVAIGSYFGLSARSTWSGAKDACPTRIGCSDVAVRMSIDARTEANISTIAFVAGGTALVGGTILILTAASPSSEKAHVSAAVDPRGGAWLTVSGSF